MPEYTPFQRISSKLFGRTAEDLRRQLVGPIRVPMDTTEQDLEKLDQVAKQAWTMGKGSDPRKMVFYGGQLLPEQKARWLIVQEAKLELKRRSVPAITDHDRFANPLSSC